MSTTNRLPEEAVSWILDEITVHGTLTRPSGPGPFPGVVFIAGSGPTDRDWTSPLLPGSNGSAALLAQALAARGYLSLRYDKRASGPHIQENMQHLLGKISMQGHIDELAGAVKLLSEHPDVTPERIFALANSEGCLHALAYQGHTPPTPFAGLILTGAPARPIGAVARDQVTAQLQAIPDGEALLAAYDTAIAAFVADQPMPLDERFPDGVRILLMSLASPANQPFARELWVADPAALLAAVDTPTLVVIGKNDIQIDWHADGEVFAALAAQRTTIHIIYPEHANHVLKYEPRPRAELNPIEATLSYNAADAVLDPDALTAILTWLEGQRA